MSNSPFRNLVLPAILVSTTVFTVLNLTVVSRNSSPAFSSDASEAQEPQQNPTQPKDFLIRYVGFTIIISVGMGIATVEGLRKWQAFREASRIRTTTPVISASEPLTIKVPSLSDDGAFKELNSSPDKSPMVDWAEVDQFLYPPSQSGIPAMTLSSSAEDGSEPMQNLRVLASYQQYQTCRVQLPQGQHRLFAIQFEGQYYSFVRRAANQDQALKFATKLNQQGSRVIITITKAGYVIWIWQPDAYPELVS